MGFLMPSAGISVPPVPPLPPAAAPPSAANPQLVQSTDAAARRAQEAAGGAFAGTVQNTGGAGGLQPAPGQTAGRSLLG